MHQNSSAKGTGNRTGSPTRKQGESVLSPNPSLRFGLPGRRRAARVATRNKCCARDTGAEIRRASCLRVGASLPLSCFTRSARRRANRDELCRANFNLSRENFGPRIIGGASLGSKANYAPAILTVLARSGTRESSVRIPLRDSEQVAADFRIHAIEPLDVVPPPAVGQMRLPAPAGKQPV